MVLGSYCAVDVAFVLIQCARAHLAHCKVYRFENLYTLQKNFLLWKYVIWDWFVTCLYGILIYICCYYFWWWLHYSIQRVFLLIYTMLCPGFSNTHRPVEQRLPSTWRSHGPVWGTEESTLGHSICCHSGVSAGPHRTVSWSQQPALYV